MNGCSEHMGGLVSSSLLLLSIPSVPPINNPSSLRQSPWNRMSRRRRKKSKKKKKLLKLCGRFFFKDGILQKTWNVSGPGVEFAGADVTEMPLKQEAPRCSDRFSTWWNCIIQDVPQCDVTAGETEDVSQCDCHRSEHCRPQTSAEST